ncbi:TPA: Right origin-binding protein, partial [Morganella morganii]|nr:Right origin-binding protein [Morganella morganii]
LNIIRHPEHPDTEEYIFKENITELNPENPKLAVRVINYYIPVMTDTAGW